MTDQNFFKIFKILTVACGFYWLYYSSIISFTLITLIPILGIILSGIRRKELALLIYKKENRKVDITVPAFILLPACFIKLKMLLAYNLDSYTALLPWSSGIFLFICVLIIATHKLPKTKFSTTLLDSGQTIIFLALFSYSVSMGANILYDTDEFETYSTEVISTREYHKGGKKPHTRYYATLKGFESHRSNLEISITKSDFESLEPGDIVYMERHKGFLNVSWYQPN